MNALQSFLATLPCGFLTDETLPTLIKLDRLHPCLVRCGGCRFQCAAQYVPHLVKCIEAGGDWVRDVSIPTGCEARAAAWVQDESVAKTVHRAANLAASHLVAQQSGKTAGGYRMPFCESQCGGVFDGNTVTSDADPGL